MIQAIKDIHVKDIRSEAARKTATILNGDSDLGQNLSSLENCFRVLNTPKMFDHYTPDAIVFNYLKTPLEDFPGVQTHWYIFFDGTAEALIWTGQGAWNNKTFISNVIQFGCKHDYRQLSFQECREREIRHKGNCWHVAECKVCGHIYSYDTSD